MVSNCKCKAKIVEVSSSSIYPKVLNYLLHDISLKTQSIVKFTINRKI